MWNDFQTIPTHYTVVSAMENNHTPLNQYPHNLYFHTDFIQAIIQPIYISVDNHTFEFNRPTSVLPNHGRQR